MLVSFQTREKWKEQSLSGITVVKDDLPFRKRLDKKELQNRATIGSTVASIIVGLGLGLMVSPWLTVLAIPTWVATFIATGHAIAYKRKVEDERDQKMIEAREALKKLPEETQDQMRSLTMMSDRRVETANRLQARVVKLIIAYDEMEEKVDDDFKETAANLAREARATCNQIVRLLAKVRDEKGGGSYWIDDLSGHIPLALNVMEEYLNLDKQARTQAMVEKVITALQECRYAVAHKRDIVAENERSRLEDQIKALSYHRIPDDKKDDALWKETLAVTD